MPQEFHVGHRSTLVSILGWLLMALGLAALGLAALVLAQRQAPDVPTAALLAVAWSALAGATGFALWRRLEWARRCAAWLLASLLPVLLLGQWLSGADVPALALLPASGVVALLLSWALKRLNSRGVRQEFA